MKTVYIPANVLDHLDQIRLYGDGCVAMNNTKCMGLKCTDCVLYPEVARLYMKDIVKLEVYVERL